MVRLTKPKTVLSLILLLASLALATPTVNLPFGSWTRASNDPILSPQGSAWESAGAFNPAVQFVASVDNLYRPGGPRAVPKIVMLYRAQDAAGTSRLG